MNSPGGPLWTSLWRILCLLPVSGFLATQSGAGAAVTPPVQGMRAVEHGEMRAAVEDWLDTLGTAERDRAILDLDDPYRTDWAYVPRQRRGMPLGDMSEAQRQRARALVNTGLSDSGHERVTGIIELEAVLYERSGQRPMRDPGNYFVTLFGRPSDDGPWGWRFEGHHLSLNFTLQGGRVLSSTPAFFGGNPARVTEGPRAGLRPLAEEEDLARRLVRTLPEPLRARAILSDVAPDDILTGDDPVAEMEAPRGVRYGELDAPSAELFEELLALYAGRLHGALAAAEMADIEAAGGLQELAFAWAGGTEPGEPHYYRIQGPTFVLEYDNTQSNANHIHSVWRNFARDFGGDPLRAHLARDHGLGRARRHAEEGRHVEGGRHAEGGRHPHPHREERPRLVRVP